MNKIIAVGHHKNVGKDTFVRCCIDILRPTMRTTKIVRRGFADKLYDFCYSVYAWAGFQPRVFYQDNPEAKNTLLIPLGKTVRQVLIEVGNHMRQYDDSLWINANLRTKDFDILFVSDVRFPNEFEVCEKLGAIMVHITRPGLEKPTDITDCALDGWDDRWHVTIDNNEDRNKLAAEAKAFVQNRIIC